MLFKKVFILIVSLVIFAVLVVMPAFSATGEIKLSLATGNPLGGFYPIGVAVSEVVTSVYPEIKITPQVTAASTENLRLVSRGAVDLAMLSGSAIYDYVEGKLVKIDLSGFNSMWSVGTSDNFVVALKGSGIKTIYDLKGKRVSVGSPGSGTEKKWRHIFEAHGMTHDDMNAQFLSHTEAADAMKDGRIEAEVVAITGRPAPSIIDISMARELEFIGMQPEAMSKIIDYGYYMEGVLPAGTYNGLDKDITIVQDFGVFVAREGLDDEIVYKVMKAIFENLDKLAELSPRTIGQTEMTRAIESMVKLHPGAEKYYQELDK